MTIKVPGYGAITNVNIVERLKPHSKANSDLQSEKQVGNLDEEIKCGNKSPDRPQA